MSVVFVTVTGRGKEEPKRCNDGSCVRQHPPRRRLAQPLGLTLVQATSWEVDKAHCVAAAMTWV